MKKNILISFIFLYSLLAMNAQDKEKSNAEFMEENQKIINEKKDKIYDLESNKKDRREEPDFLVEGRKSHFLVAGGSIGSPASANLNVGYYFNRFVVRGSGMYWGQKWNGIQGDLGWSFYKTKEVIMGFSGVMGRYEVNPFNPQAGAGGQNKYTDSSNFPGYQNTNPSYTDNLIRAYIAKENPAAAVALDYYYRDRQYQNFSQSYIGLAYDLYLDGFFLQIGAGIGKGAYRDPQLVFQMGYLVDFGKNK
jgi:hypothetical protein